MSSVVTGQSDCLNCGAPLSGAYCVACGQKATAPDPTFHDFLHELTHELLHVDGRLFQSVWLLLRRPGFLTVEHREGRRARYVAPMRLYLIFSLIYFVLAIYAPIEVTVRSEPKRGRVIHTGGLDISGEILSGRSDEEVAHWVRTVQHEWGPRLMFVLVPAFALLTMLSARRQHRHFPQHLYFAIHLHAAWFAVLALAEAMHFVRIPAVNSAATILVLGGTLTYTTVAIRQVYGVGWVWATWRALWTQVVYLALLITLSVVLFIALYSYGLRH